MRIRLGRSPLVAWKQKLADRRILGAASLAAADVAGKLAGFLITPYLANRMGAGEFGLLNLYLPVIQIVTFLISFGGAALLVTEYIRNGYSAARRLRAANLQLAIWMSVALLALSACVSLLAPSTVPLTLGLLIVAVSFVQALNIIELSYYRGTQTYSVAVAGQCAFVVLSLVATFILFELKSATAANRLLCLALAGAVVQTVYALELRRRSYEPGDRKTKRSNTALILRFGSSIFVHSASQWVRVSVDRFVISGFLGTAAVGVYSLAATLAMAENLFFGVVSQQLQPFLYGQLKKMNFASFRRVQLSFMAIVVVFTGLYYGFLLVAFDWLFNTEYTDAKTLLPILLGGAAAQALSTNFLQSAFYERRATLISRVTVSALSVHLCGLAILIFTGNVSPANVATVFLVSSIVAMLGTAWLSLYLVRQLRSDALALDGDAQANGHDASISSD
ncbi:MAG: oligosaccharide flippase family protein [Actinomycetia bacterium]|nr:oligosaccharide flippase family protein [Actinomycetes bacterium]